MFIDFQKSQRPRRSIGRRLAQRPRTEAMTTTIATTTTTTAEVEIVESTAVVVAAVETTRTINNNNNNSDVTKTITRNKETDSDIYPMNYYGIDTTSIDAFKLKYFLFS